MSTAAFFDLDRTLVAGSSGYQFARAAAKAGIFTRKDLWRITRDNVRFRLHGSTDEMTDRLKNDVAEMIRDVPVRDLERLTPDILAGLLPRVFPQMLRLAWDHQDAGRRIYIVTAASQEMAQLMARTLVFDGAIGFRSEIVDGRYTGRPAGPFTYREGKAQAIRELAERKGIDLGESYAYSDSESDLPMLRAVGHPVAVNPDAVLARVAREEGWEIVRVDKLHTRVRAGGGVAVALAGATVAMKLRAARA